MIRILLLTSLFQISAYASTQGPEKPHVKIEIPNDKDVLSQLTPQQNSEAPLPTKLSVLSWNVHKGSEKEKWAADMKFLSSKTQIIGLQEAMRDDFMPAVLSQSQGFSFWMAQSFLYKDGSGTGVSTGSRSKAKNLDFSRSPGREPVLNTPKMTLLSTYMLENGKLLLVANLHGMNFVVNSELEKQLTKLRPIFEKWTGPLLFMGDFNTWNAARTAYVDEYVHSLNLLPVPFPNDARKLKLDHIFVRGCQILKGQILDNIKTSDHAPLWASLDCH